MNKLTRIKDWFRYDLPRGIKNLIVWFPVIWKDRNFDQHYIFLILHHKLKMTEENVRNGPHTTAEQDAKQIKLCVLLLERLIKDDYLFMVMKDHDIKWGSGKMVTEPIPDKPNYCSVEFMYENVHTPDDEKNQEKDFNRAIDHEQYLRNQDLDVLFNTMKKYILGWWT